MDKPETENPEPNSPPKSRSRKWWYVFLAIAVLLTVIPVCVFLFVTKGDEKNKRYEVISRVEEFGGIGYSYSNSKNQWLEKYLEEIDNILQDYFDKELITKKVDAIEFQDSPIPDELLSDLAIFETLKYLYIDNSKITNLEPLANLANLPLLDKLSLHDNQISDLLPLKRLTSLKRLLLNYNMISDLSPLSGLTQLWHLDLSNNQITDLSPLENLKGLIWIYLDDNQITDLAPVVDFPKLERLSVRNNQLTDLPSLAKLTNLIRLYLSKNKISELSQLEGLKNLVELRIEYNQITDIKPLAGLKNLSYVDLDSNQIADLTPLYGLPYLVVLSIYDNPEITLAEIDKLQKALPNCKIFHNATK
jgi:Leucine-rich repeat (LRR) protein